MPITIEKVLGFYGPIFGAGVGVGAVLLTLGLVWAPFGAVIFRRIARANGLDTRSFTLAGAALSMMILIPWLHIWVRMRCITIPSWLMSVVYLYMHLLWLLLIVSYIGFTLTEANLLEAEASGMEKNEFDIALTILILWTVPITAQCNHVHIFTIQN